MWMFSGQSQTGGQCDVQQGQLLTSLTTYIELYSSQKNHLKNIAGYFSREESDKDKTGVALLGGFCGASLGATVGVVCGSIGGSMGAVAAAALFRKDLNAVGASVGFFGGVLGGLGGATFAGMLGGAVGAAAKLTGHSVDSAAYNLLWSVIGGATGAGIGHIFGGKVGTVAGSVGGGFGAFCGVTVTLELINCVLGEFNKVRQNANSLRQRDSTEDSTMQNFQQKISSLIAELSVINTISSKMDSWAVGVAAQSSKCLIVFSGMEKALAEVQNTPQTGSSLENVAKQCKHMSEELEMMKREAEKLLSSRSRQNNAV